MGAMGDFSRVGIILLAIAFMSPCFLISMPVTASTAISESPIRALDATQYNSSALFQPGVCFNEYSSAMKTDPGCRDFAIGDLDGDGLKDLAVIAGSNVLLVYDRLSDGAFSSNPQRLVNSSLKDFQHVAIGDLNNDGLNDIVVSCNDTMGNSMVAIFCQSSGHIFSTLNSINLNLRGQIPHEISIGHFTNKTLLSVAVVSEENEVDIWSQPYSLPISPYRTYLSISGLTRSQYLAASDIDSDGWTDLVVGQRNGPDVAIFTHNSTGAWNPQILKPISGAASDVGLYDVNSDGRDDLIFANSANSQIYAYFNNRGVFETNPHLIKTADGLSSVTFGEVSGDGRVDAVYLSETTANCSASFKNANTGWYGDAPNITFPVQENPLQCIVDRSVVGKEQLLVLCAGNGVDNSTIEFFPISNKLRGNANQNLFVSPAEPQKVACGKLADGSGLMATTAPSENAILLFNQRTGTKRILPVQANPVAVVFGHFDGDFSDDLAVLNQGSKTVSIYLDEQFNSGTQPRLNVSIPFSDASALSKVSVRNDSFDDLVIGSSNGLMVLYNTESASIFDSTKNETLGGSIPGRIANIVTADFSASGIPADIAALNSGSSSVEIFSRYASGTVGNYYPSIPTANLTRSGSSMKHMVIGNFGGSPQKDIAVLDDSNQVFVFVQPSYGFTIDLSDPAVLPIKEKATGLAAGDLNDDGMDDLAVSYNITPIIAVFLRTGDSTFKNCFNWTSGGVASDIAVADINGDLRPDVLSASPTSFSLSVWFQNNLSPKAVASASKTEEYEGRPLTFSGALSTDSYSDQPYLAYNWTFAGEGYRDGITVNFTFTHNGSFMVTLRVTDRGGLQGWDNITINIKESYPIANFTWNPSNPYEGEPILFNDTSVRGYDPITFWFWDFGDGGSSTLRNPQHTFTYDDAFMVHLTVTDSDGTANSTTKIVVVNDTTPIANFTFSDAVEGSPTLFNNTSTTPYDPIVYSNWTFGDSSYENKTDLSDTYHTYNRSETFQVTLTITDNDGSISIWTANVFVRNVNPIANFTYSPRSPIEGQPIQFNDTSFTFNKIVSWSWHFGDGQESSLAKPPPVTYGSNGTYNVSLTVVELDGSNNTIQRWVFVADTSPTIILVKTVDNKASYAEDQTISVEVLAEPAFDPLLPEYAWDMNFNGTFTTAPIITTVNHTSFAYARNGVYLVCVRVFDIDGFTQASSAQLLAITVYDPPPTAFFNFHNVTGGIVQFDASGSSDNPSDIAGLQFSWNFDDGNGYTAWNETRIFDYNFTQDGMHTVALRVRDDSGQIDAYQRQVMIHQSPPDVIIGSGTSTFFVGHVIEVSATVTDSVGVLRVDLSYQVGNGSTNQLRMTPTGSADEYRVQLPALNHTGTITYWITAIDTLSNSVTTGKIVITISDQPASASEFIFLLLGALTVILVLFLFMRNALVPVEEVFIIYNDGRLMAHQTRRLKPGMDDEILSSMLVAIQGFVKDSFKDESSTHLQRLDFGEKKILVERGDSFYLAVVLHSHRAGNVPQRMQSVIENIHREYGEALNQWDGDLEKVRGVKDQTEKLFKSPIPLALSSLKREKAVEPNECPMCGNEIMPNAARCPSCGAELSSSALEEIEAVAEDTKEGKGEGN